MFELMIALFLVGSFALPLAQFPMGAVQEEYKSAYRMQAQRLADLAFTNVKERLYKKEISWKEIAKPRKDKVLILDDVAEVSFEPLGKRKFTRQATLYSIGKAGKNSEEWRLATVRVKITPQEKRIKLFRSKEKPVKSRIYTYQVLISKSSAANLDIAESTPKNPPLKE
jgi:hypothetical protein